MSKNYLNSTFEDSLKQTRRDKAGQNAERKNFMSNNRDKNGLQIIASDICFQSANEYIETNGKKTVVSAKILTLLDLQVLDKIEGSQHRYLLKKNSNRKSDCFNFHLTTSANAN